MLLPKQVSHDECYRFYGVGQSCAHHEYAAHSFLYRRKQMLHSFPHQPLHAVSPRCTFVNFGRYDNCKLRRGVLLMIYKINEIAADEYAGTQNRRYIS